ncbi:hypothetical protein VNI00_005502 [Paramarasmius palmivorus]|uniref:Uncharacterized protein n=1 Tax=Paramarasmius palmivorus TaxID=297713 RepID=A0AAW0DAI7_9AGAR
MSMGQEIQDLGYKFTPLPTVMEGKRKKSEQQMEVFEEAVVAELSSWVPNTGDIADRYKNTAVAGVFNFLNDDGMKIQLVATKGEAIEAILGFHSMMNIATAMHLISLYPTTSFLNNEAIYLKEFSPSVIKAVQKYEQRGWSTVTMITAENALDVGSEVSFKTRWIGDPHCWITELAEIPNFKVPPGAYRGLWVVSWHHFCPGPQSIRIILNRFQSKSLKRTYVVTWEAERAIWSHHCFRMLEEKIRWRMARRIPGKVRDGQANSPILNRVIPAEEPTPLSLTSRPPTIATETPFAQADDAQWKYIADHQHCVHRNANNIANVEDAVIEFLRDLYPLFDKKFKTNSELLRVKRDFGFARKYYAGFKGPDAYPTGHTISAIMRCVELIKHIEQRDSVKFSLRFSRVKKQMVWTTCIMFVLPQCVSLVKKELADWPKDVFDSARLTIRIGAELE